MTIYEGSCIAYNWTTLSSPTTVTFADPDEGSATLPIGFSFQFFDDTSTDVTLSPNGALTFDGNVVDYQTEALPGSLHLFAMLAFAWNDLDFTFSGSAVYKTTGSAPNRVFVLEFDSVPQYQGTGTMTCQVKLYETTNVVEVHTQSDSTDVSTNDVAGKVQGVQGPDATWGLALTGRNYAAYTLTNDAWRLSPTSGGVPPLAGALTVDPYGLGRSSADGTQGLSVLWPGGGNTDDSPAWRFAGEDASGTGSGGALAEVLEQFVRITVPSFASSPDSVAVSLGWYVTAAAPNDYNIDAFYVQCREITPAAYPPSWISCTTLGGYTLLHQFQVPARSPGLASGGVHQTTDIASGIEARIIAIGLAGGGTLEFVIATDMMASTTPPSASDDTSGLSWDLIGLDGLTVTVASHVDALTFTCPAEQDHWAWAEGSATDSWQVVG